MRGYHWSEGITIGVRLLPLGEGVTIGVRALPLW